MGAESGRVCINLDVTLEVAVKCVISTLSIFVKAKEHGQYLSYISKVNILLSCGGDPLLRPASPV